MMWNLIIPCKHTVSYYPCFSWW